MNLFRNAIIALTATTSLSWSALAADLPPSHKAAPAAAPYQWTGLYIGANLGYGAGRIRNDYFVGAVATASDTVNPNGVIGGAQLGLNWQTDNWVFGLETDFQGSGQSASTTAITCPATVGACGGVNTTTSYSEKILWFGTTRGRVGYASGSWLFYGTAGAAYAGFKADGTITTPGFGSVAFSSSQTKTGWTAGGGVEAAVAGRWTWKAEYLYMDFGSLTTTPAGAVGSANSRVTNNVGRFGVNYRF